MLTRRQSTAVGVLVGVLAAGVITANLLSVTPIDLAAIGVHGGKPVVLLGECKRYEIVEVKISPARDRFALADDMHGWVISRPPSAPLPAEVEALGPPPAGWWTDAHPGSLTSLAAGQLYAFSTLDNDDAVHGPGSLVDFRFTLADVNRLGPGQVLVAGDKRFGIESEKDFRRGAKGAC
jgi:hypothetical protein